MLIESKNKRKHLRKKVFCRISEDLINLIKSASAHRAVKISKIFEDAIDNALSRPVAFESLLCRSYVRQRGRRRGSAYKPIGTIVSAAHYRRLLKINEKHHRFLADVIEAALLLHLRHDPAIRRERESFAVFLDSVLTVLSVDSVPYYDSGKPSPSLRKIESGAYVLIDPLILLYGATSLAAGAHPPPISQQCHELLRRCRSGELTGMITSQSLAELWNNFWNLQFRVDSSTLQSWKSFPAIAQMREIKKKLLGLIGSSIGLIDITKEDFIGEVNYETADISPYLHVASALRQTKDQIVVATPASSFDMIESQRVLLRKPNDILREPPPAHPPHPVTTGVPNRSLFPFADIRSRRPNPKPAVE